MISEINKIIDKLQNANIAPGQRIAILSDNSAAYSALILACWKLGITVVPISTKYPHDMINKVLPVVGCNKLFLQADKKFVSHAIETFQIEDFSSIDSSEFTPPASDTLDLNFTNHASIIFTSASTATPKAVLHTIANHYYSAAGSSANIPFAKPDRWLMSLPMYHISGFSLIMRALLNQGTLVFPVADSTLSKSIETQNPTHISLVAAQLAKLLDSPNAVVALKQTKAILIGGSAIPQSLIDRALAHDLNIYTTYGSTELASQITTTSLPDIKTHKNTSGRLLSHRQLKIADDGEILIKGQTMFVGYIKNNNIDQNLDPQGYFHTGDIGYIKNENLFVTGRKDLMFISGGQNIYPEEIQRALETIDGICQTLVVPVGDKIYGQRPVAFIKTKTDNLDTDYIINELSGKIENYKIPVAIIPWPDFSQDSIKINRQKFIDYANFHIHTP
ncbi:MAG: o-succinylbenzoate--CoA ligase [Phycisphaerae bacterium]|nr:o-succinylbenzoate--CoA ligase [Phycisphaerae bacterium]